MGQKGTFYTDDIYQNEQAVLREVSRTITHIMIEEGITYLENSLKGIGLGTVSEIFLPSALEKMSQQMQIYSDIMHFYYERQEYVLIEKVETCNDVGYFFSNLHYVMTDETKKGFI